MVEKRFMLLQYIVTASVFGLITHVAISMYDKWKCKNRDNDGNKSHSEGVKSATKNKSAQKNKKSISEVIFINEETYACADNHKIKNEDDMLEEDNISEVIFTNEMTYNCTKHHQSRADFLIIPKTPNENPRWTSLSDKCRNPHCATKNVRRLLEFIDKTQYSIDVAMYTLTQNELASALIRASKRGVNVRVLTDKDMKLMFNSNLKTGLVQLRYNTGALIMHHKFVILDGKLRIQNLESMYNLKHNNYQSLLLSGSLNWTNQGTTGNYENCLISSNKSFVQKYEEEFQRMWNIFAVNGN